jgi:hypothetical protein
VAPTAGDPLAISGRKKTKTVIGIVTECIEKCSWVLREHGPLPGLRLCPTIGWLHGEVVTLVHPVLCHPYF